MEYDFVEKTSFVHWFWAYIASALQYRYTDASNRELFQVVLLEKNEDIDLLKEALNQHRQFTFMIDMEVKEMNWYDMNALSTLSLLHENHTPLEPTDSEIVEMKDMPLTINAWRFYPGNGKLLESEVMPYGVRHSAYAINIIALTKEEFDKSIEVEIGVWRYLVTGKYDLRPYELTDIPQSLEELEKRIEEKELKLQREIEEAGKSNQQ